MTHFQSRIFTAVIAATVVLTGCTKSTWEKMSDDELAMRASECMTTEPGPAMAQVCANIERECQRRRKNKNYTC